MLLRCLSIRESPFRRRRVFNISALTTPREAFKPKKIIYIQIRIYYYPDQYETGVRRIQLEHNGYADDRRIYIYIYTPISCPAGAPQSVTALKCNFVNDEESVHNNGTL